MFKIGMRVYLIHDPTQDKWQITAKIDYGHGVYFWRICKADLILEVRDYEIEETINYN